MPDRPAGALGWLIRWMAWPTGLSRRGCDGLAHRLVEQVLWLAISAQGLRLARAQSQGVFSDVGTRSQR